MNKDQRRNIQTRYDIIQGILSQAVNEAITKAIREHKLLTIGEYNAFEPTRTFEAITQDMETQRHTDATVRAHKEATELLIEALINLAYLNGEFVEEAEHLVTVYRNVTKWYL